MKETSRAWQVPELGGLEVMHASFVRHHFAKHSHETFTVVLIDDGASRFWYRGIAVRNTSSVRAWWRS